MSNRFANGRKSFGFCDVCSFRFPLRRLKNLVVKTKETQIKACPQCWTPDQPQLQLGMYPIADPQAIRDPRPDTNTWFQSGVNALNNVSEGMLVIQWGWAPIGGASYFTDPLTPNTLVGVGQVGQVTIGSTGTPAFTAVELLYTIPGTYSWVAPAGVTSIYALCIGGGGSGSYNGTFGGNGVNSSIQRASPALTLLFAGRGARGGSAGTGVLGEGGGAGGTGTTLSSSVFGGNGGNGGRAGGIGAPFGVGGGGGAGGYIGNGGAGGADNTPAGQGYSGAGGGGAGGSAALLSAVGGGGVGTAQTGVSGIGDGAGGSGGTNGTTIAGGVYGAGGGARRSSSGGSGGGGGGGGGLRWAPALTVVPGVAYNLIVGAGGVLGSSSPGGSGAVKIAYWQPVP